MHRLVSVLALAVLIGGGAAACSSAPSVEPADTLLTNGRVYTFSWGEPGPDGAPSADAPRSADGWHPDAEAIAVTGGRIAFVGAARDAEAYRGPSTRVIDLQGATALPGLVDSHVHIRELGQMESYLDLTGVQTEQEAVDRVVAHAATVPKGEWIVGRGWDEGAWANRYPTLALLTEKVPDHPVVLASLHGFAMWGNKLAFERAKITRDTPAPNGGIILKDASGNPSGTVLNRATPLLMGAVPPPTPDQARAWVLAGLARMARDGYVAVHEAGADAELMTAFESLRASRELPTRVYAMISAREPELSRAWQTKGPLIDPDGLLTVRSVKAYYDGSLGSRGARLLDDYADQQGHRGVSGGSYGFDQALVADMMKAGFQVGIHAIGDAGNRETLDFLRRVEAEHPAVRQNRNRIEHAQVVHPDDFARFAEQQVVASMEPPHAVEDKGWAGDRLGPDRVTGAYAWRAFRRAGVRLIFNSDLTGSDHNIFYGLHSAITRRDKTLQPAGGWYPEQNMTPEEAVRGYSTWAAYASFHEQETGVLAPGRWADITVMDIDPLVVGSTRPDDLLKGTIRLTMMGGRITHDAQ
jgi:predicted amidohydrolase YtcJ